MHGTHRHITTAAWYWRNHSNQHPLALCDWKISTGSETHRIGHKLDLHQFDLCMTPHVICTFHISGHVQSYVAYQDHLLRLLAKEALEARAKTSESKVRAAKWMAPLSGHNWANIILSNFWCLRTLKLIMGGQPMDTHHHQSSTEPFI